MTRREAFKAALAAWLASWFKPASRVYWDDTQNKAITLSRGMVVKLPKGWRGKWEIT